MEHVFLVPEVTVTEDWRRGRTAYKMSDENRILVKTNGEKEINL